jgi:hypothetical protein
MYIISFLISSITNIILRITGENLVELHRNIFLNIAFPMTSKHFI